MSDTDGSARGMTKEAAEQCFGPFELDLGCGVFATLTSDHGDETEKPTGLLYIHPDAQCPDRYCSGGLRWEPFFHSGEMQKTESLWRLVALEPLTLEPSLLCRRCGHHGFIRSGKWVPA